MGGGVVCVFVWMRKTYSCMHRFQKRSLYCNAGAGIPIWKFSDDAYYHNPSLVSATNTNNTKPTPKKLKQTPPPLLHPTTAQDITQNEPKSSCNNVVLSLPSSLRHHHHRGPSCHYARFALHAAHHFHARCVSPWAPHANSGGSCDRLGSMCFYIAFVVVLLLILFFPFYPFFSFLLLFHI